MEKFNNSIKKTTEAYKGWIIIPVTSECLLYSRQQFKKRDQTNIGCFKRLLAFLSQMRGCGVTNEMLRWLGGCWCLWCCKVMLCTQGNCQSTGYLHSRDLVSCACIKVSTLNHKPSGENTSKLEGEHREIITWSSLLNMKKETSSVSILEEARLLCIHLP